jgi:hypothetical protein
VDTVRSRVDYSLAKRATLVSLFWGSASATDVCDAHPYLLRAAKHHGEPTDQDCPVCHKDKLTHVTYTYGDALGEFSGRIKASRELEEMEQQIHEFTVYVEPPDVVLRPWTRTSARAAELDAQGGEPQGRAGRGQSGQSGGAQLTAPLGRPSW